MPGVLARCLIALFHAGDEVDAEVGAFAVADLILRIRGQLKKG